MANQPPSQGPSSAPQPPPHSGPPPLAFYPPQALAPQQYAVAVPPSNGIGTAAGVLGIVAAVLMFIPFIDYVAIILGVLAVILGGVGINRSKRLGGAGKGMAITGLVLGIISVAISILFIAAIYAAVSSPTITTP
jgi:hypothetical protein